MWLWVMAGAAVLWGIFRSEFERNHLQTEYYEIHTDKICEPEVKIVFLSDLHNQEFGTGNQELLDQINKIHPDLILTGGDMMVCKGKKSVGIPQNLLLKLREHYPVYAGNGNHENRMEQETETYGNLYQEYVNTLSNAGITVLEDSSVSLASGIDVYGMNLDKKFYQKSPFHAQPMPENYINQKMGMIHPDQNSRFRILLAHSPLYFDRYTDWGADLILSGHFHGGTIRLPLLGGVMTPQYQFFSPWCAGMFQKKESIMIVSRGLGTHSINIRINNRPELAVITLKRKTI